MNFRLFCLLGILVCLLVSWLAPHYLGAARVVGYSFLGFATLATLLGYRTREDGAPAQAATAQQD